MELKPWEPGAAVPVETINDVSYVQVSYLLECFAEIARLKEDLAETHENRKMRYLSASEREKVQAALNAHYRQALDDMPTAQAKE